MRERNSANTDARTKLTLPSPSHHRPLPPIPNHMPTHPRPHDHSSPLSRTFAPTPTTIRIRPHIKPQPPTYPDKTTNTYSQNRWTTKVIHPTRALASPSAAIHISLHGRSHRPSRPLATTLATVRTARLAHFTSPSAPLHIPSCALRIPSHDLQIHPRTSRAPARSARTFFITLLSNITRKKTCESNFSRQLCASLENWLYLCGQNLALREGNA